MILIGQYDSPFVRRVAVALGLYGLQYEHWTWSAFGDAERLAAYNPLRRVPTLVLADGEVLVDSAAILDHLDEVAGPRRLIPGSGASRRAHLRVCALANGLCDKMVTLLYERVLREAPSPIWVGRCEAQIGGVLDALEADHARQATAFWFGTQPGHADIAVACAMRFLAEAHPDIMAWARWPGLIGHSCHCEAMEEFRSAVQPLSPPSG